GGRGGVKEYRGGGAGARVFTTAGVDGGAVRGGSVWAGGNADVSDGGLGARAAGRAIGVCGAGGCEGPDTRISTLEVGSGRGDADLGRGDGGADPGGGGPRGAGDRVWDGVAVDARGARMSPVCGGRFLGGGAGAGGGGDRAGAGAAARGIAARGGR